MEDHASVGPSPAASVPSPSLDAGSATPSIAAIEALAPEGCICFGPDGPGCVCPDAERALRAVARGDYELNSDAREWCLSEIDRIEGYSRSSYEGDADRNVAGGVLYAWADFCRDKGLL